ncbi:translation initiation factor IF-3 [Halofilum ochraceum]|uniref:translation initiation factor IF-3 n=1 Tax=Halofilum ochraceum TaxID=1611323 RepID=UPI000946A98A|nr:translation initiation factor IF-3 [Halofilum ochraceum]
MPATVVSFWRGLNIAQEKKNRRNEQIDTPQVRLIGSDGEQVGIVNVEEAIEAAKEENLDLVEVVPNAEPPVCRIMDYGRFRFEQSKKKNAARKKAKQIQIKEVKFRPGTEEGDYRVKMKNLTKFLEQGDKAKVTLRFRGREMAHREIGSRLLERVRNDLEEIATVEQFPKMEGRQMIMVLAPRKNR